jgi:predicted transcriptional regulator
MTPRQVYGNLAIRNTSAAAIAKELDVSEPLVRAVIRGSRDRGSLARIVRRHIAQLIEVDVAELPHSGASDEQRAA